MLTPPFDSNGKMPVYEQIYHFIRKEIECGALPAGYRLPSKRKFSAHLRLSQCTIENAYAQLTAEGYIDSLPRRGYFVHEYEQIPHNAGSTPALPTEEPAQEACPFDLKTSGVDTQHFPFSIWAKLMRECLSESGDSLLQSTAPQGDLALRTAIVQYLRDFRGINTDPRQIVLGAGSEYLLGLVTQLLDRSCIYAVENPGYPKTRLILQSCGLKTVSVSLDAHGLNAEHLRLSGANIAHVTPSHHFPLGIVMPAWRRQKLLQWANEREERYIIEDDYDSEFRFSGRPIPALQSMDKKEKVIYMNTFAKTLAPSLRISYMVLPPHLVERYRSSLLFYSCTIPSFEQFTLRKFLENGSFERHLSRMRNRYKLCRDVFIHSLQNGLPKNAIQISGQQSGLHLLLSVHNGMDECQLVSSAKQQGVRVYGLSSYDFAPARRPANSNRIVVGYSACQPDALAEAATRLRRAWF